MLDVTKEPWPPVDYVHELRRRQQQLIRIRRDPRLQIGAREYYRTRPIAFARDWCFTYEPRFLGTENPPLVPFVPFKRQVELFKFVIACLTERQHGLVEKSRDMGATWICVMLSVHMFLFVKGASIGWGSRKAIMVDSIGNPDSIFEKIRILMRNLPQFFFPPGFSFREHVNHMRIVNPETLAAITGEVGDDIGRGGRSLIYFKDESAHYVHPEPIEAALNDNALVQIDVSSVNGLGNVFHRKREAGQDWVPGVPLAKDRTNVFVMDWRDHPAKTQAWYDERKAKARAEGLLRVHAQEIDRNYSASITGTIIPADWVRSAIDAHLILNLSCLGGWCAALDVSDGEKDGDTNALAKRQGIVLKSVEEWGEIDTGLTANRAVTSCSGLPGEIELQYDCIGVGSGVKAETNRLRREKILPRNITLVPWNAGDGPLKPEERVIPGDSKSPKNEDFYQNLKAQGWWQLRLRFERTHRAVRKRKLELGQIQPEDQDEGWQTFTWREDELIVLPSDLPLLWKLVKELSQPVMTKSAGLKLMVDKAPDGTVSPNLGDATMMVYWPMPSASLPRITDAVLQRARMSVGRAPTGLSRR